MAAVVLYSSGQPDHKIETYRVWAHKSFDELIDTLIMVSETGGRVGVWALSLQLTQMGPHKTGSTHF